MNADPTRTDWSAASWPEQLGDDQQDLVEDFFGRITEFLGRRPEGLVFLAAAGGMVLGCLLKRR